MSTKYSNFEYIRLCKTAETLIDYIISEQDFIREIFVSDTLLGTDHQMRCKSDNNTRQRQV